MGQLGVEIKIIYYVGEYFLSISFILEKRILPLECV